MTLPLWWRDDDAVAPTPALARLTTLSEALELPVHLAVIPARAEQTLADNLSPQLIPVVHGWAHKSHSFLRQRKSEFSPSRAMKAKQSEAKSALHRLQNLFGDRLVPMFVPPWNRIGDEMMPVLADLGYQAVSTYKPRSAVEAAPGLLQMNTHLDPIDWRGSRSVVDPTVLVEQTCQNLQDRRLGHADNREAFGILTHHLVHDAAIWSFAEALIGRLLQGPAEVWQFPTAPQTNQGASTNNDQEQI
nr:polysaccharide deacetylase family protein [Epibacterium ulvae]